MISYQHTDALADNSRSERRAKVRKKARRADVPFSLKLRHDEIGRAYERETCARCDKKERKKRRRKRKGAARSESSVCTCFGRDYVTHSALVSGVGRSPMVVSVRVDQ